MVEKNITLLSEASETGSAASVGFGGDYVFAVAGTFGAGTVGLEMLGPDGATWIAIRDLDGAVALTAAGATYVSIPAGSYRATITGATGASLYATLRSI